jgi:hypothetical protein
MRQDQAAFANLFQRLKGGTMEALDGRPGEASLTQRRCSFVSIWQESGATLGELRRVKAQPPGTAPAFVPESVPGARFSIS